MEFEKGKTRTSWAASQRYKKRVYTQIAVRIPKEMAAEFKAKCAKTGIPIAQVVKDAIAQFLDEEPNQEDV